jgi:hypothetical protein
MNDKRIDPIGRRLDAWRLELQEDPALRERVLRRLAGGPQQPRTAAFPLRWAAYAAAAALLLAAVFVVSQRLERHRLMREGGYCLMIDPVYRAHAAQDGAGVPFDPATASFIDRLAWMQERLDLSRPQFLELVALHDRYADRFNLLYEELVQLEDRYGQFEALRRADGLIDFMALYDVLAARRAVEHQSHTLSREFIDQALAILTPQQRPDYLALVRPVTLTSDG